MNVKYLLLGALFAALSTSAFAADALLSPRAQGNQIKVVSSLVPARAITVAYVTSSPALLSPRAQGSQVKVVQGVINDTNPTVNCRQSMLGTPKAVTECSSHVTRPGCLKLALMNQAGTRPVNRIKLVVPVGYKC